MVGASSRSVPVRESPSRLQWMWQSVEVSVPQWLSASRLPVWLLWVRHAV